MSLKFSEIQSVISSGKYKDTWESLSQFRTPAWFEDAKFGIFVHWGLYSIPAFSNEWYSRNMYIEGTPEYEHHIKTYGALDEFGYKDFIPMFTAERFDPEYWAELFSQAGAQYVVPVAEHHDGFQMYSSDLSEYNAKSMGPCIDIIGELANSIRRRGMIFATSTHRAEHHWFMGPGKKTQSDIAEPLKRGDFYWPAEEDQPDFQDLYALPYPSPEFLIDWVERTCEIIDKYKPAFIYFDWWIQHEAYKPYLRKIAAYYYNRSEEEGFPAAICYKHDAMSFGTGIPDVERGKFTQAKPYHWQTDTAIARNSWCHTTSLDYKSSNELICYLADVVSKNGNLLLNVGPKADGSFAGEDLAILLDIGNWLRINGEAIYKSKPWRYSEEGPTKEKEGEFSDSSATEYTSMDIRFTCNNGCIYAIFLKCPGDGEFNIRSISKTTDYTMPNFHGIVSNVSVLGFSSSEQVTIDEEGLHFTNHGIRSEFPVVVKIETV